MYNINGPNQSDVVLIKAGLRELPSHLEGGRVGGGVAATPETVWKLQELFLFDSEL